MKKLLLILVIATCMVGQAYAKDCGAPGVTCTEAEWYDKYSDVSDFWQLADYTARTGAAYDTEAELKALMSIAQVSTADDTDTITPTAGYKHIDIDWTPASNPSGIAIGETGAIENAIIVIRNVDGTNVGTIAFAANNFEHNGGAGTDYTINPGQCVIAQFDLTAAKWVVIGGTGSLWASSINMSGGVFELPNGDAIDTSANEGEFGFDTDGWLRINHGTIEKGLPVDENISVTILQPDDADEGDTIPLWCNFSGMSFEIHTIYAMADADDADFDLESAPYTDFTDLTEIESIQVSTDSTGVYTYTIGAGAGTDIDEGTIPTGECIIYEPTADDLEFVTVTILGYYLGDVD